MDGVAGGGEDEIDIDQIEVGEGESLEDIKAKAQAERRHAISAEMLDTANTYDDKVAVIRMIVSDEAGRVSNVFKSMMSRDIELTTKSVKEKRMSKMAASAEDTYKKTQMRVYV